ncbi:MAG: hypothetical protein ACW9W9_07750, partial [Candidatus Nitrosopumilus sp. Bin_571-38]
MEESIFIIITFVTIYLILEIILFLIVLNVRKKFQWMITSCDEKPKLSEEGLKKFIPNGYDSELGWIRKPNTSHKEKGKFGVTEWNINNIGARNNPSFEKNKIDISCHGDSFTFCRQVNDNETWEHYLSKKTNSNVQNFGVGNYGIDQSLLRLKREIHHNSTKIVIMGVVPDTISRILSLWKHYYEYGNTFAFKPRYIIKNNEIFLIKNIIDDESKFLKYEKELDLIKENDFFYSKKFQKEKIYFPYTFSILKNPKRNISIIYWVMKIKLLQIMDKDISKIEWNPMKIIMNINLQWRIKLYKEHTATELLYKIIEEFARYTRQENIVPVFVFLPQKDDILFIKKHHHYYCLLYTSDAADEDWR